MTMERRGAPFDDVISVEPDSRTPVIPAPEPESRGRGTWIPAFAGKTTQT